ncbi:carbamoyl-phosphate synthase large subunit [Methanopyrus kandleri]|uniref:Carbamoyl phosphate synthase large chain, C-terminal section n=2 Tax=Methanopyrus kandleri TaxID=2320 RepID=CARB2_METKA|nr:carbamoyl-phosphate synthase large subunit [Methanopyrus kandleri]Q8TUT7.1 RecName: Full=Carbamoyl phosphate synthase large chain, C-terminal section; AltName: Full=Carbamoyl phosphate synthetase ammonia chain [Methanopyrus kandleri AV19]AAM02879.1 Carbamoylphosphate synthase large subunit [Methanopyrus kandleri AV19]HII70890.1 carbamoyl-phosphate synthase large subunit [Methanopyrus kandleri]
MSDKVLVIGAGPNRIGQGIEFDYCTVHAVWAIQEEGYKAIIVNNNPETVSTDYDTSDKLYFEPITLEDVLNIVEKERPIGVLTQFGGQTSVNLTVPLAERGVRVLGTDPDDVDRLEDRDRFSKLLKKLGIPQPESGTANDPEEAVEVAEDIGYPVLVRPSYVIGGRAMEIVYDEEDLRRYIEEAAKVSPEHPILIDRFIEGGIECEIDGARDEAGNVLIPGIMEHIEEAGVHSGDSACVVPPQTLPEHAQETVLEYAEDIAEGANVIGLINIQFVYDPEEDEVYVIEANPRASRTVPFISKAVGIPLAKIGTKAILGREIPEVLDEMGLEPPDGDPGIVAVKEAVFSFEKWPGVDPVLGPEMKATGEVMGIDRTFGAAYWKAQLAAGHELPLEGTAVISVADRDKPDIVPIARKLQRLGFDLLATRGTASHLREHGIECEVVRKVSEGSPNIVDLIREGEIDLIINTPTEGKDARRDGYAIRRAAVKFKVPYITTIAAAKAAVEAIELVKEKGVTVNCLHDIHKGDWTPREVKPEELTRYGG